MAAKKTTKPRPAKIPLAERSLAEQVKWMRQQLSDIDASAMVVDLDSGAKPTKSSTKSGFVASCKRLKTLIKTLRREFPSTTITTIDGQVWKGSAIPAAMTYAEHPKKDHWTVFGSLFHMVIKLNGTDADVRWLLASGFDPSRYYHQTGTTPAGLMSIIGLPKMLMRCREAGADLTLLLRRDQMQPDKPKNPDLVNSTLLHRTVLRFHAYQDEKQGLAVINELLLAGLDPLAPASSGRTPRDMATGAASELIEKWVADMRAAELLDATVPAKSSRSMRL